MPNGLRHYAGFWHNALFDGYGFGNDKHPTIGYLVSAFVGIAAIAAVIFAVVGLARRGAGDAHQRDALPNGSPA